MNYTLITNNPSLSSIDCKQIFVEGDGLSVLLNTRDYIHRGYTLISSPLGASIRMIMSPVKTVIVSQEEGQFHEYSLMEIEAALEKHKLITFSRGEDFLNCEDYAKLDKELTLSALNEANTIWR